MSRIQSLVSRDFLADQKVGDLGEELWASWLSAKGGDPVISENGVMPNGKTRDWDVYDKSTEVYYEVKMDIKAHYWAKKRNEPVNLFLEYETVKTQKPCGIMKPDAQYLVYIVRNPEDIHIAYTFELEKLKDYLWSRHKTKEFKVRKPTLNGIGNVNGWTPPLFRLIEDAEGSGFQKRIVLPLDLLNPSHEKTLSELSMLEKRGGQAIEF